MREVKSAVFLEFRSCTKVGCAHLGSSENLDSYIFIFFSFVKKLPFVKNMTGFINKTKVFCSWWQFSVSSIYRIDQKLCL